MRQHGISLIVGQLVEQRQEDQDRVEIIRAIYQLVNPGFALQDRLFGKCDPVLGILQHLLDRRELLPVDQSAALEQLGRKLNPRRFPLPGPDCRPSTHVPDYCP